MDDVDIKILNYVQNNFPVDERPYLKIAEDLSLDETEVIERVKKLHESGYIKKIIPKFSKKFYENYERALVALKVDDKDIEKAAILVNSIDNVTHNYLRDHDYNVWFTISGKDMEYIKNQISAIVEKLHISDYMILKSIKTIKLDTEFEVKI